MDDSTIVNPAKDGRLTTHEQVVQLKHDYSLRIGAATGALRESLICEMALRILEILTPPQGPPLAVVSAVPGDTL
jgi:hypothetical protein